ncbi:MAG: T9SS type A sorting domain-containing protein, partial [bacterium]
NASGVAQWTANGVAMCTATNSQSFPAMVSDNAGGAIVGWEDLRNGDANADIYASRVNQNGTLTAVKDVLGEMPIVFLLEQNYPNPFNPTTKIQFSVGTSGPASLRVFDVLGRRVATLVNENLNPGSYEVSFDGKNLASGVYLYRLKSGTFSSVKRMVVIK